MVQLANINIVENVDSTTNLALADKTVDHDHHRTSSSFLAFENKHPSFLRSCTLQKQPEPAHVSVHVFLPF